MYVRRPSRFSIGSQRCRQILNSCRRPDSIVVIRRRNRGSRLFTHMQYRASKVYGGCELGKVDDLTGKCDLLNCQTCWTKSDAESIGQLSFHTVTALYDDRCLLEMSQYDPSTVDLHEASLSVYLYTRSEQLPEYPVHRRRSVCKIVFASVSPLLNPFHHSFPLPSCLLHLGNLGECFSSYGGSEWSPAGR